MPAVSLALAVPIVKPPSVAVFNPALYGTLLAWYSVRDASPLTPEGQAITTLPDLSGNGLDATASGTLRPLYQNVGGLAGRQFNIGVGGLNVTSVTLPVGLALDAQSFTVVIVGRLATNGGQQVYVALGGSSPQFNWYQTSATVRGYHSVAGARNSSLLPNTGIGIQAITGSASALKYYTQTSSASLAALPSGTMAGGRIGQSYAGGDWAYYECAHLLFYNSELSAGTLANLRTAALAEVWPTMGGKTWQAVFIGDSMTQGYGAANNPYPRQMLSQMSIADVADDWTFGYNGAFLASAPNPDTVYNGSYAHKWCVVWMGTNDLSSGTTGAALHTTLSTYCSARRAAGWKVAVGTIAPRNDGSWSAGKETQRLAYNTAILAGYTSYADALFDPASDSRLSNTADSSIYVDALHMTATGYGYVAELAAAAINANLP